MSDGPDFPLVPPSPEGASHPDEMEAQYSRLTATLQVAFDKGDREVFEGAISGLHAVFALALDRLRRGGR